MSMDKPGVTDQFGCVIEFISAVMSICRTRYGHLRGSRGYTDWSLRSVLFFAD